jgi:acetylornithine deacetylase/succinyl-diaminopimelate desuccinylase-like protein
MNLEKVYDHIDASYEHHVERIREFIRQPTISNTGVGMEKGATLLLSYFEHLGCKKTEIAQTPGWPVVYGYYDAGAKRTLLIYMMYDCMPADEPGWTVKPFDAALIHDYQVGDYPPFKTAMVARGTINTKGPLMAFLNACESIREANGELPVNLLLVAEGEEEQASRHLPLFLSEHKKELNEAEAMFFPSANQSLDGNITITPGTKGIRYWELECSGASWGRGPKEFDIHGSMKVIVDSPVWRMIHALETMTTEDGNRCLIDGWYDNVEPPNEEEREIIAKLAEEYDWGPKKASNSVDRFILDEKTQSRELLTKYFCEPSGINIDGIYGGYTGEGSKTLLPHKVTVKMDVRLVPNQRSSEILPKVRAHLDRHGYSDIRIRDITGGEWARTSIKSSLWSSISETYESFGLKPRIDVRNIGYAPFSLFTNTPLNLPGGFGYGMLGHGTRAHAPNEYFVMEGNSVVKGLRECEKSAAGILCRYATKP